MHGTDPTATDRTDDGRVAYRPEEVAVKLGVSRRYVYTLINQGEMRAVVLAGRWMVLDDDLKAFVETLKVERAVVAGGAA